MEPEVKELTKRYEEVFRELGQQLGQMLVQMMVRSPEEAATVLREAAAVLEARPPEEPSPQPSRILPGLAGRRRRPGEAPPKCGRPDCTRPSRTRGYCQTHYVQWLKAGKP